MVIKTTYSYDLLSAHICVMEFYGPNWAENEVDIIVELDGIFYPIKVKAATTISKHDIRGITAFKETYPQLRIANGIVIYAGDECYRVTETIIAVPWNLQ